MTFERFHFRGLFILAFVDPRVSQGSHTLRFYIYICICTRTPIYRYRYIYIFIYIYIYSFSSFYIHSFNYLFYNVIIIFSFFICVCQAHSTETSWPFREFELKNKCSFVRFVGVLRSIEVVVHVQYLFLCDIKLAKCRIIRCHNSLSVYSFF